MFSKKFYPKQFEKKFWTLKVLDSSEEFSEVREIIDRYNTLVATHLDLLEREQQNQVQT